MYKEVPLILWGLCKTENGYRHKILTKGTKELTFYDIRGGVGVFQSTMCGGGGRWCVL